MRISDWSSDVCSSDLGREGHEQDDVLGRGGGRDAEDAFQAVDESGELSEGVAAMEENTRKMRTDEAVDDEDTGEDRQRHARRAAGELGQPDDAGGGDGNVAGGEQDAGAHDPVGEL